MLQKISTDKAPAAIGPYSQGIVLGNIFFASGQIPIDPATGEIHGTTIEEQAEQVMKNIGELLKAAGTDYTRILQEAGLQSRLFLRTYYVKWKSLQKYNEKQDGRSSLTGGDFLMYR